MSIVVVNVDAVDQFPALSRADTLMLYDPSTRSLAGRNDASVVSKIEFEKAYLYPVASLELVHCQRGLFSLVRTSPLITGVVGD